jgi:hypothetical protein
VGDEVLAVGPTPKARLVAEPRGPNQRGPLHVGIVRQGPVRKSGAAVGGSSVGEDLAVVLCIRSGGQNMRTYMSVRLWQKTHTRKGC